MIESLLSSFHSPWLLLGLAVLAIPPIIHLLNRRRYEVVDWGAMQFLQISEVTRRRIMLEEVLLMALRMGLLALLVLALAGPFLNSTFLARVAGRPNRDVVLVIDGSASMSALDEDGKSPADRAREWALAYLDDLTPGDGVAVLLAREQVLPVVGDITLDLKRARAKLRELPAPAGGCAWPEAVKRAWQVLAGSQRGEREVILLGDNQKQGWADSDSLFRWELLAAELGLNRPDLPGEAPRPRVWAVDLGTPVKEGDPPIPNWALTPLRGNRPVVPVDREVTLQADILLAGSVEYAPPHRIRLEVDGKPVRDLPPPKVSRVENGKIPFSFTHKFGTAGSHLVSVVLEADPPAEERPRGYVLRDRVPGDNRQDFSVEVLAALPVLIVDGDTSLVPPTQRATDFLRDALSPARDKNPVVQARVVALNEFTPTALEADPQPRVLVLHNLPRLDASQQEAVTRFLGDGGGVLVTLGDRVEPGPYNELLFRGGEGWLPARLDGVEGDEGRPREGVKPDPATFTHPTLELFRRLAIGGLGEARFPRWWKLTTPGKHAAGVAAGLLRSATASYPFLVERTFLAGRVLVCAAPLDNTWATNLTDLPAFVPLAHELVYYLAGARSAEFNLRPGQPIRYRARGEGALASFRLESPAGVERPLGDRPGDPETYQANRLPLERGALLTFDNAREAGVWKLTGPEGADQGPTYYVVQSDGREAELAPASPDDREKVGKFLPVTYENDRGQILQAWATASRQQDIWQYLLLGLVALLCGEVWMTRRMVMNR